MRVVGFLSLSRGSIPVFLCETYNTCYFTGLGLNKIEFIIIFSYCTCGRFKEKFKALMCIEVCFHAVNLKAVNCFMTKFTETILIKYIKQSVK